MTVDMARNPSSTILDFDPEALRRKYAQERETLASRG